MKKKTTPIFSSKSVLALLCCSVVIPLLPQTLEANVVFSDNFSTGSWEDPSGGPEGFWSRQMTSTVTSQALGTEFGRFIQMIEPSHQSNKLHVFWSDRYAPFNLVDKTVTMKLNDIQYILPETLGEGSWGWYSAWGFADSNARIDSGNSPNHISYTHRFHSSTGNNRIMLYAGATIIGQYDLPITGLPTDDNRANIVLPVNIELTVNATTATLTLWLSNDTTQVISGTHGFDPAENAWMYDPLINMTGVVSSATALPGRKTGITLDEIIVSSVIPEPATMSLLMGAVMVCCVALRRLRRNG